MKRIRPAPMGRAFRYQRRLAHIIVTVAEKKSADCGQPHAAETTASTGGEEDGTKKAATKTAAKKPAAKKTAAKKTLQPRKAAK